MSPYTLDEMRKMYLDMIRAYIDYWAIEPKKTCREKLEGLAFSILLIIDGESALPAFSLTPIPHPGDRQYCIDNGERWWPSGIDIAGGLHEDFVKEDV